MKNYAIGMREKDTVTESEIRELWGIDPEHEAATLGYLTGCAVLHLFRAPLSPTPADEIEKAIHDLDNLLKLEEQGVRLGNPDQSGIYLSQNRKGPVKEVFSRVTTQSSRVTKDLFEALSLLLSSRLTKSDLTSAKSLCRRIIRFLSPDRVPFNERPIDVPDSLQHLWASFPPPFNAAFEFFLRAPFFREMPTDFEKGLRILRGVDTAEWTDWPADAEKAFMDEEAFFSAISSGPRHQPLSVEGKSVSPFDSYLEAIGPQASDAAETAEKIFSAMADVYFSIRNDPDYVSGSPKIEEALEKCKAADALLVHDWKGKEETPVPVPEAKQVSEDRGSQSPAAREFEHVFTASGLNRLPLYFDYATGRIIETLFHLPFSGTPARAAKLALRLLQPMIGSIREKERSYQRGSFGTSSRSLYTGQMPFLCCSPGNKGFCDLETALSASTGEGASPHMTLFHDSLETQTDFASSVTRKAFLAIRDLIELAKRSSTSNWSEPPNETLDRVRKEVLFIQQAFEHAVCENDDELNHPTDITAALWKARPGIVEFNWKSAQRISEDHPEQWYEAFPDIHPEDLILALDRCTGNVILCLTRVPFLGHPEEELEKAERNMDRLDFSKLQLSGVIPPAGSEAYEALERARDSLEECLEAGRKSLSFEVFADSLKLKKRYPNKLAGQILRSLVFLIKTALIPSTAADAKQKAWFFDQAKQSFNAVRTSRNSDPITASTLSLRAEDTLEWAHSVIDLSQEGILERFPNGRIPYEAIYRHAMPISSHFTKSKKVRLGAFSIDVVRTDYEDVWYVELDDFEDFLSEVKGSGNPGFHLRADTHLKNGDILCVMGTMFLRLRGAVRYLEDLIDRPANPDPKEAAAFQTWARKAIRVLSAADPENQPESESQKDPE